MEMLRSGSSGDAVLALQRKLWALGFDPGPTDGIFGPKTDDAVKRYQEDKGLQVDGIAGPETFTSLEMMEGEKAEATEVAESADAPGHDRHRADSPVEKKAEVEPRKTRGSFMAKLAAKRQAKRARKRG